MGANLWYVDLRIATTEAGLAKGQFFILGLPEPDLINVQEYGVTVPQATGGQGRQGYPYAALQWNTLTQRQAYKLRALVETAEASDGQGNGTLWLTLPRTSAQASGYDLVDISGIVWLPTYPPLGIRAYENVLLRLNNITFENVPSDFV